MLSSNTLPPYALHSPRKRWLPRRAVTVALSLSLAVAASTSWFMTRTSIMDLGSEQQLSKSGLLQAWANGAVIVMIRHAERCDSAPGPCLDDPAGITVAGSQAAGRVGEGLKHLGLADADLLSSPKVRTQQTAHFILGQPVSTREWIGQCDGSFPAQALAAKRPEHNLVLVTHSGCVDQFARQQSVAGDEQDSGYASALFVSVDDNGKARILGRLNEPAWQRVLASAAR
ncbi:histidine phosphatase family protein [Pseudomonas aeruginosa]